MFPLRSDRGVVAAHVTPTDVDRHVDTFLIFPKKLSLDEVPHKGDLRPRLF